MSNSSFFDAYYYEHGCGRPYERNEGWLNFFDGIAKRILISKAWKLMLFLRQVRGKLLPSR